jgi:hypothetical protein
MTGSTNLSHRRLSLKQMAVQKSSVDGIGPADVALPATAMALIAVVVHRAFQLVADNGVAGGPLVDGKPIGPKAYMKAFLVVLVDIEMAISTCSGGIRKCRILHHPLVCRLPVGIIGIAAVAFMTCYVPMVLII